MDRLSEMRKNAVGRNEINRFVFQIQRRQGLDLLQLAAHAGLKEQLGCRSFAASTQQGEDQGGDEAPGSYPQRWGNDTCVEQEDTLELA
jgi:hypothetical protein